MRQQQASISLVKSRKQYRHKKTSPQTSDNANTSEFASQSVPKPKGTAHAKKSALNPTKRAFSDRQKTTIRDNLQASAKKAKGGR